MVLFKLFVFKRNFLHKQTPNIIIAVMINPANKNGSTMATIRGIFLLELSPAYQQREKCIKQNTILACRKKAQTIYL